MTDRTLQTQNSLTTADGAPVRPGITFYGADWCGDTRRSRALLHRFGIPYTDVNVDENQIASDWAATQRGGERRIPTIVLAPDEPILFEPSDDDLRAALVRTGYLSPAHAAAARAAGAAA